MKRFMALVVAIVFLALAFMAAPVYADDSVLDKMGDWWAVRGKEDPEKSVILARRRAGRAAKRAEKAFQKSAKDVEKSMKTIFEK